MSGWQSLDTAPRDRKVWLFLPCASWTSRPDGTVTGVRHLAVIGEWKGHWVNEAGNAVYPSLWHGADVKGVMPDNPLIEA